MRLLPMLMLLLLAACAIGDTASEATNAPPITLAPPPTMIFAGTCTSAYDLELWLGTVTVATGEFLTLLNAAAEKPANQTFPEVTAMARIRDGARRVAVPDCGQAAQDAMVDVMDRAVSTMQSRSNGENVDLNTVIDDLNNDLYTVVALQEALRIQLETLYSGATEQPVS